MDFSTYNRERYLAMSSEDKRKEYQCGDQYRTLSDIKPWDLYRKERSDFKFISLSDHIFSNELSKKVSIFVGNITHLEVDAVVNSTNVHLAGYSGVDAVINTAAGRELLQPEIRTLGGCELGNSKITGGYKLPAKYIIHTVGTQNHEPEVLRNSYRSVLELMEKYELKSVAFPCVSTGINRFPNESGAQIALSTVRHWLESSRYADRIERIIFCLYRPVDVNVYHKLMPIFFPIK